MSAIYSRAHSRMSLPCSPVPSILASTMLWTQRSSVSREVVELMMCKCTILFGLWTHNSCANLLYRFANEASRKLPSSFVLLHLSTHTNLTFQPRLLPTPPAKLSSKFVLSQRGSDQIILKRWKMKIRMKKTVKTHFFHPLQGRAGRYWTASERLKRAVFLDCASQIL